MDSKLGIQEPPVRVIRRRRSRSRRTIPTPRPRRVRRTWRVPNQVTTRVRRR